MKTQIATSVADTWWDKEYKISVPPAGDGGNIICVGIVHLCIMPSLIILVGWDGQECRQTITCYLFGCTLEKSGGCNAST